ncbi:MAG: hypothetical protein H8E21_17045 [Gammaproteobacteria bacterium]|nr:hypothetical protein [Gammaproteobacteria bacterium]
MKMVPPAPGVSRTNRLSDEGLQRLQKQLDSGLNMSDTVLAQWIRRYGESARVLIRQHGRYVDGFDAIENPAETTDE